MTISIPYSVHNSKERSVFDPFWGINEFERAFFDEPSNRRSSLPTDIRQTSDSFILEADLPGVKKEDIKLELTDDVLSITAVRHSDYEQAEQKGGYVRCERPYGSYHRSFDVSGIDSSSIDASFTDGVLRLTLPKIKPAEPQTVTLEIK